MTFVSPVQLVRKVHFLSHKKSAKLNLYLGERGGNFSANFPACFKFQSSLWPNDTDDSHSLQTDVRFQIQPILQLLQRSHPRFVFKTCAATRIIAPWLHLDMMRHVALEVVQVSIALTFSLSCLQLPWLGALSGPSSLVNLPPGPQIWEMMESSLYCSWSHRNLIQL